MGELPVDVVDGERRYQIRLAPQLRVDEALVRSQGHRQAHQRGLLRARHRRFLDLGELAGVAVQAEDISDQTADQVLDKVFHP